MISTSRLSLRTFFGPCEVIVKALNVALAGCGTVGGGVAEILFNRAKNYESRVGPVLNLAAIADLQIEKLKQVFEFPDFVELAVDVETVIKDSNIDVIVELIGGIHPALEIILDALENGKDVVTANKALLAKHADEIFKCARENGRCVAFEASVGGGIPIIAALRDGFVGNRIRSVYGIVNGTCNYIITKMLQDNMSYEEALAGAQDAGYAETPPTLDVEGTDTAHKLAVMARIAFGVSVPLDSIHCEGITDVSLEDVKYAETLGYTLKLLAVARRHQSGLELRVNPCLLRKSHQLAGINGAYNAICVNGDAVGQAMLTGLGAGRMPTASAVVADLVSVAMGTADTVFSRLSQFGEVPVIEPLALELVTCRYFMHMHLKDRPGVLALVAGVFGSNNISIASCIQQSTSNGSGFVPVVFMTHEAQEGNVRKALAELNKLEVVSAAGTRTLRVEDL